MIIHVWKRISPMQGSLAADFKGFLRRLFFQSADLVRTIKFLKISDSFRSTHSVIAKWLDGLEISSRLLLGRSGLVIFLRNERAFWRIFPETSLRSKSTGDAAFPTWKLKLQNHFSSKCAFRELASKILFRPRNRDTLIQATQCRLRFLFFTFVTTLSIVTVC